MFSSQKTPRLRLYWQCPQCNYQVPSTRKFCNNRKFSCNYERTPDAKFFERLPFIHSAKGKGKPTTLLPVESFVDSSTLLIFSYSRRRFVVSRLFEFESDNTSHGTSESAKSGTVRNPLFLLGHSPPRPRPHTLFFSHSPLLNPPPLNFSLDFIPLIISILASPLRL